MRVPLGFLVLPFLILTACPKHEEAAPSTAAPPPAPAPVVNADAVPRLFTISSPSGGQLSGPNMAHDLKLTVRPGNPEDADRYYNTIRTALSGFPIARLQDSTITDMFGYFGYNRLSPVDAEQLDPAALMKEGLSPGVKVGDVLVTRFFAPKIINVGAPQVNGVPRFGFGWRKVLRFRALDGSNARRAGLDAFFLLFNFASNDPVFPAGKRAGQIQGILQPVYGGTHRDLYFLVYEALDAANPQRVRAFLEASFDLVNAGDNSKYYVPIACAQCHGSEVANEKGAKVNYLDTDHFIDRTGDDFKKVNPASVIVDGAPAYDTFRALNTAIVAQNEAVGGKGKFAWLAGMKWLELHAKNSPDANRHVPPLRRGFVANAGDKVWTAGNAVDEQLLPMLNQYCYRCHSSVRYHVFQKQVVFDRKDRLKGYVSGDLMPQDRKFDAAQKSKFLQLMTDLQ